MRLYINIVGSGRHEGYNLPAYVDIAMRGRKNWAYYVGVKRIYLPRWLFRKTHCWTVGK